MVFQRTILGSRHIDCFALGNTQLFVGGGSFCLLYEAEPLYPKLAQVAEGNLLISILSLGHE